MSRKSSKERVAKYRQTKKAKETYKRYKENISVRMEKFSIKTKICPRCGIEKLVTNFYRDCSRKYGYSSWCRVCIKNKAAEEYNLNKQKNRNKKREYLKSHYKKK